MSYLLDIWVWVNFAIGFFALAALFGLAWLVRLIDVSLFNESIPYNLRGEIAIAGGAAVGVFGVWYAGYLVGHYRDAMPYVWPFLAGGFLALAGSQLLFKLGPHYSSASQSDTRN